MKIQTKAARLLTRLWVCLLLLVLLGSLLVAVLFPDDILAAENRYANKMPAVSVSGWLDGSWQQGVQAALSDQVPLANTAKKVYNKATALPAYGMLQLLGKHADSYVWYEGIGFYRGRMLYAPRTVEQSAPQLTAKAENYNALFSRYPQLDFYLYYIEKDTDMDYAAGTRPELYACLQQQLALPQERMACFSVPDWDTFCRDFYVTDHHWNHRGSYRGYTEAAALLGVTDIITPQEEVATGRSFSGSKAIQARMTGLMEEEMTLYRYALPPMTVMVNGEPAAAYGAAEAALDGSLAGVSYAAVYGADMGEVVFDTGSGGENLLVLGESYDNAVLELLAAGFGKTCAVDLRYYEAHTGHAFDFGDYVAENEISKVLLMGNIDYFVLEDFRIED